MNFSYFNLIAALLLITQLLQAQQTYDIGDRHPLGGIVFKVTDGGKSGWIIALQNSPGPTQNWEAAQQYCKDLGTDWYMPSKEEMRTIVSNLDRNDLKSKYFWTSTEKGNDEAYIVLLQNGVLNWPTAKSGGKNYVRPIRAFTATESVTSTVEAQSIPTPSNSNKATDWKQLTASQTLRNITLKTGIERNYGQGSGIIRHIHYDALDRMLIGGDFSFTHEGKKIDNLAIWEHNKWTALTSKQGEQRSLGQILDIANDSKNNIYVISEQSDDNYDNEITVRKWDGNQWTILGTLNGRLATSLAIGPSDELYVCGDFAHITTAQGRKLPINIVAKYQNGTWQGLGASVLMLDIAVNSKGVLYGLDGNGLVRKNVGGRWTRISPEIITNSYSLGFDSQDNLYITGYFGQTYPTDSRGNSIVNDKDTRGNDVYFSNVAKFDGNKWTNLNGGFEHICDKIITHGNDVYFIDATQPIKKWDGQQFTDIMHNGQYIDDASVNSKGEIAILGSIKNTQQSTSENDKIAVRKQE